MQCGNGNGTGNGREWEEMGGNGDVQNNSPLSLLGTVGRHHRAPIRVRDLLRFTKRAK